MKKIIAELYFPDSDRYYKRIPIEKIYPRLQTYVILPERSHLKGKNAKYIFSVGGASLYFKRWEIPRKLKTKIIQKYMLVNIMMCPNEI